MLREFLERQYSREEPEQYRALNLWAAQLFESQENYSAAVNHRVKVEAYDDAAATVIAARGPYLKRGSWQALQVMLATLPAGVVDRDPELSLTHADLLLRLGDPGKALETIDRILSRPETLPGELEGRARTIKSPALRTLGQLERAVGEAEQAVRLIKLNNGRAEDLSEAYRQVACALGTQGKWEEATQNLVIALSLVGEWNPQLVSLIHLGLGCALMEKGELYEALAHFEKARQGWHQLGDLGSLAETINNISVILFLRGDFELALEELDQSIECADETGNRRALATAFVRQGVTLEALDRGEEGLTCLRKGLEVARAIPDLRLVAYATSELGNAYRKRGRASEGQTLVERALVDAEESNQQYFAARFRLSLGKIHWHLGARNEALQQLTQARQALSRLGNIHVLAEATLWEALVHYRSDEIGKATERLEETAGLVAVLGYQGFLLADARDLYPVIRFAAAKRMGRGMYGRLLERIAERAGPDSSPSRTMRLVSSALPAIVVQGFQQTRVFLEGHEVTTPEWRSRKAKELLLFLLCRRTTATKEELIDALWPEGTGRERSGTVKTTIYRLRQATYPELTVSDASGYFVNPDAPIRFDLYEFEHCLDLPGDLDDRSLSNIRMERLEKAVQIYKGAFLNEFYAEWCQPFQRELEVKFRTTLQTLADHYIALHDYPRAISVLLKAVSSDPYDELANYRLIQAYDLAGDIHSARQRREVYYKLVREDLGEDLPKRFSDFGAPIEGL